MRFSAILSFIALLFVGCATPSRYFDLETGDRFPERWLTKRITMEELQSRFEGERALILPESVTEWERFKKSFRSDYEVWDFHDEALPNAGFIGYVILRDGRVVDIMGAFMTKKRADPVSHSATPLISPKSSIMFTLHMAQLFKRDGSPARRAWLI